MIRLVHVSKTYPNGGTAVRNLSLNIEAGEFVVLIGPSGSGKSTTLSLINRLIEPSAGTIEIDGENIAQSEAVTLRRRIGFVFQGIGLFPHLTVAENIGITPRLLGWQRSKVAERTQELLQLVRLAPERYAARYQRELSGGEQQRVGVARALAAEPKIMLMDEPFGALDPLVRDELGAEVRSIHNRLGLTTVLVTHDMTEALLLADRIVVMRDGGIVQSGTPAELVRAPANDFVREMIENPRRRATRLADLLRAAP
ncbi:MAG TPA: ATP-binding cassette domain-containing protein [Rhizomicrobium sp.]|nr:ATP-binding cassette domain-containing protein [Rhizomicrobium sp.]